jgi:uncharacterized membrane protein HdeD (DUF308 family)
MELKHYDKSWLPAFKGAFLIIFGIIAMLNIVGTIKSLGVLFGVLIVMISILLIATGIRDKNSGSKWWTITLGVINLGFFIFLILNMDEERTIVEARGKLIPVVIVWMLVYAISEIIEAVMLYMAKNGFAALFLINSILTLVFAYFLYIVTGNFTEQSVFNIGIISFAVGLVNVLSSYLLNRVKA